MSSPFQKSLESKLNDLAVDYMTIFHKEIEKSYLARDLLRLYRKFKLYIGDKQMDWVPAETEESEGTPSLVTFLNAICILMNVTKFDGEGGGESNNELPEGMYIDEKTGCIQITAQRYSEAVPHEQMHQSLTNFLVNNYGHSSRLCKLLKCVDQAYVVALLGNLAESLFFCKQPMRFKDIQGTWTISVRRNEDNFSFIHRRREQMLKQVNNSTLTETFQFSWELELVSDSLDFNNLQTLHVRLLNIDWSSLSSKLNMTDEEKRLYENEFRNMFGSSNVITINDMHKCVKQNKLNKGEMLEQRKQVIKNMDPKNGNNQNLANESEGGYCTIL
jgi:hypothetical protein